MEEDLLKMIRIRPIEAADDPHMDGPPRAGKPPAAWP